MTSRRRLYDITWLAERVCDEAVCIMPDGSGWTMWFDIKGPRTFHAWLDDMQGEPIVVMIDERHVYVKHPSMADSIKVDVDSDIDIARAVCKFAIDRKYSNERELGR